VRDPTGEVTDLLQHLIRNACINDGSVASGHESRSVDILRSFLDCPGLDLETYQPAAGRESLIARIEGSEPGAPALMLMGHTDVVPANPDGWRRDPFGAELIDSVIWGRGAVDMLNLTASMAVAMRQLADQGFRPRGTLIFLAVADEEALGTWGADWLTTHQRDAVDAAYVLTEPGGVPIETAEGIRLPVAAAEKGTYWVRLTVHGTSGHGSQPLRSDNALVTAAAVVARLAEFAPPAQIHQAWRRWVNGVGLEPELAAALLDPEDIDRVCQELPLALARQAHACTHTTFAPTIVHGGVKTNVIPDRVQLEVDIRTLPGQRGHDVAALLDEALGDLAPRVEIEVSADDPSTESPLDTPLWDSLSRVSGRLVAGSQLIPSMTVGATDARFFRRLGTTAYGFGLLSDRITFEEYHRMFHGDNERIDIRSLELSTQLWHAVATDFLASAP
jgi:acetylornithine deacetylase/succinyl-diaminopimelate desuccinylase-like protein